MKCAPNIQDMAHATWAGAVSCRGFAGENGRGRERRAERADNCGESAASRTPGEGFGAQ